MLSLGEHSGGDLLRILQSNPNCGSGAVEFHLDDRANLISAVRSSLELNISVSNRFNSLVEAGAVVPSRRDEVSLAQHVVLGFVRNREYRVP